MPILTASKSNIIELGLETFWKQNIFLRLGALYRRMWFSVPEILLGYRVPVCGRL